MPNQKMSAAKRQIFEKAVELFAASSYEAVSIQAIARALGRRQSGIYNHFTSKQEILDAVYDFFNEYFTLARPTLDQFELMIKTGSVEDILMSVNYDFSGEYCLLLLDIYRIIHQRKYFDPRARHIIKETILQSGFEYIKAIFDKAVAMGRFAPFDTASLAIFCNNNRMCYYLCWVLDPTEETTARLEQELRKLNGYAVMHIKDLGKL